MKKLDYTFFALFIFTYISLIPSLGLATDTFEDTKLILKRTPSQEELFQLQEEKAVLVQQIQDLQKRKRHLEIEKLRKEVVELEATKLFLQTELEIPFNETEGVNGQETVIQSLTPRVANLETKTMEELLYCVTTNYDDLVANMHPKRGNHGNNVQYGLIKLSKTDNKQVQRALEIIGYEGSLSPCDDVVKDYITNRLLKPVENETLYTEDITFENVNFVSKFYVMNYEPAIHKANKNNEFFVFAITSQFLDQFSQLKGKYKDKLTEFLKRDKFEPCFTYKNTLYRNYGFTIRNTSFGGYLFLEKPFDVHLFYK